MKQGVWPEQSGDAGSGVIVCGRVGRRTVAAQGEGRQAGAERWSVSVQRGGAETFERKPKDALFKTCVQCVRA